MQVLVGDAMHAVSSLTWSQELLRTRCECLHIAIHQRYSEDGGTAVQLSLETTSSFVI